MTIRELAEKITPPLPAPMPDPRRVPPVLAEHRRFKQVRWREEVIKKNMMIIQNALPSLCENYNKTNT